MSECLICFEKCNQIFKGPCTCNYYVHNTCFQVWNDRHNCCIVCGIHIIPGTPALRRREIQRSYIYVIIRIFLFIFIVYIAYDMMNAFVICLLTM